MTQSKQWKVWERECAKDLGGTRTGPRGFGLPDVEGVEIALECKYMQRLSLRDDHMQQAKTNAKGLPWALALREAKTGRRLAVCEWPLFVEMYHAWKDKHGEA